MNTNLKNKTALVTGGTRGIGEAIAKSLEEAGAKVFRLGRKSGDCEVDLSDKKSVEQFCSQLKNMKIDILVNNAGINKIALAADVSSDDFAQIQQVNVTAPFQFCQAVLPHMLQQNWGRILNIGSIFGSITRSQRVSYTTSKAALIGMTKTLAVDYAPNNILVNTLSPGFIDTELTRTILKPAEIEKLVEAVPMHRLGSTDEIARLALFLCSIENSFMTGQDIIADGGFSLV